MRLSRLIAGAIAVLVLTVGALVGQAAPPALDSLFSQYESGDFAGAQAQLARGSDDEFSRWERDAARFAREHATDLRASAFLLEMAHAGLLRGAPASAPIFEAGCTIARTGPAGSPFDSAWQLAALALAEGASAGDDYGSAPPYTGAVRYSAFLPHLSHAESRHLDPGTVALARAILQEEYARNAVLVMRSYTVAPPATAPGPAGGQPMANTRSENARLVFEASTQAIGLFEKATAFESVRPEAMLRQAAVRSFVSDTLGSGWDDALLTDLASVETMTSDPRLVYLSRLFRGRYLEARGRLPESAKAYTDALRVFPNASSARLGLASAAFLAGQPVAADLLNGAGDNPASFDGDPWNSYRYGDYRLWDARLQALRVAVKGLARP